MQHTTKGLGVICHLFGLKHMLREGEELPKIYKDEAFGRISYWKLSSILGWMGLRFVNNFEILNTSFIHQKLTHLFV